jgi:hypothetical protein
MSFYLPLTLILSHKPIKHYGPTEASLLVEGRGNIYLDASGVATIRSEPLLASIYYQGTLPVKTGGSPLGSEPDIVAIQKQILDVVV